MMMLGDAISFVGLSRFQVNLVIALVRTITSPKGMHAHGFGLALANGAMSNANSSEFEATSFGCSLIMTEEKLMPLCLTQILLYVIDCSHKDIVVNCLV